MWRDAFASVRARPRSLVAILAIIAIAVAGSLILDGIAGGARAKLLSDLDALGGDAWIIAPPPSTGGSQTDRSGIAAGAATRAASLRGVRSAVEIVSTPQQAGRTSLIGGGGGVSVLGIAVAGEDPSVTVTTGSGRLDLSLDVAVVGVGAARDLGIEHVPAVVAVGRRWVTVTGVISGDPLAPELDQSLLVSPHLAEQLGARGQDTELLVRSDAGVDRRQLIRAGDPTGSTLQAIRPEALRTARRTSDEALTSLSRTGAYVGLAAAAVTMTVLLLAAVRQRLPELAVRRVHGASGWRIAGLVLVESWLQVLAGAVVGLIATAAVGPLVARWRGWVFTPDWTLAAIVVAALWAACSLGALLPAMVAARADAASVLSAPE